MCVWRGGGGGATKQEGGRASQVLPLQKEFTEKALALPETLYHRDDTLQYIAYVMIIWAAPIHADRGHYSLWP